MFLPPVLCRDGDMRLIDGEVEWEGRLEVCLEGRWGTVTAGSQGWPMENNHVACGYFGYEPTG